MCRTNGWAAILPDAGTTDENHTAMNGTTQGTPRLTPHHRHRRWWSLVAICCLLSSSLLTPLGLSSALAQDRSAHQALSSHTESDTQGYHSLAFAVVSNMPESTSAVPRAQALLHWIGSEGNVAFIIHLGNIKGANELCSDALLSSRRSLLDSAPVPVIYIPGQDDWADCARPQAGNADPLERLDSIRDSFMPGAMSLGRNPIRVIRQSELPAFRPYRENTRWIDAGIVFVTLNVPGDNNHFMDGGGRNGEYEDREIANRSWITRAVTDARRRKARGLVFFFEGDPHFSRETRSGFSWWFNGRRERDGFAPLRRDLIAAAHDFTGPVLLIHSKTSGAADNGAEHAVFTVEPLLREHNGQAVRNMKRIEVAAPPHLQRWLRIAVSSSHNAATPAVFRVEQRQAPLDLPPALATPPNNLDGNVSTAPYGAAYPSDPSHATPDDGWHGQPSEPGMDNQTDSSAFTDIQTPKMLPLPPLNASGSTAP